jgi:hypothetical protein
MCITQTNEQVTRLYESFKKMRKKSEKKRLKLREADVDYHDENFEELEGHIWEP